ncbi:25S rRNA (cytosine(2278)-C(5))-methyltransferase [[Candida] railenensis]|uniref:25S rRNA (Cytosine(2278)-C(5))-methyltransferase n=1 Tax=[Candida] railenensis TaxID=45579 RepID=A0A9P0QUS0_9ASCO|nr:25S rRNA (cytosine(2278)-C(5))-methyltransferase [[Candida] railenensis]
MHFCNYEKKVTRCAKRWPSHGKEGHIDQPTDQMKLYFEAEEFLSPSTNGSLQSRIFNTPKKLTSSPKHLYAVVYSTLKYKEYINMVIKKSKIKASSFSSSIKKYKISDNLLLLLVHDLLFSSRGRIQSGKHPIKDSFLLHQTRLKAEFIKLKLKYKAKSVEDFPTKDVDGDETPIRWFRVNTIKVDETKFFNEHTTFKNLQPVSSLEQLNQTGLIYKDDYIPFLYGVHPREKITSTQAYLKGEIIIQDRASCFPAHILNDDPLDIHTEVIDGCAAPGNKTTHSASYLKTKDSVVYAFERDDKRVKILKMMCERATGKAKKDLIQITHTDFTTTEPTDFPNVTGLVMDPSCSGSGIFGRAIQDANGSGEEQEQEKEDIDTERLNKLAGFQFKIMKHALSYPSARKVVYSTCSIHPHENERVVVDLLKDPQVKDSGWVLADREVVISDWPKRGWKEEFSSIAQDEAEAEKLAGGCVRAEPKVDGGIGFFAACFVKSSGSDVKAQTKKEPIPTKDMVGASEEAEEAEEEEWTGFE